MNSTGIIASKSITEWAGGAGSRTLDCESAAAGATCMTVNMAAASRLTAPGSSITFSAAFRRMSTALP
ncbi:hypothetical protein AB6802_07785 [Mesorhizobium sp. RCC_202]|uniref:hypothetical protein n=1 Tax=Mesorhizobium sp. RCC_202 TaxID=3239222 RepID=UPI00352581B0